VAKRQSIFSEQDMDTQKFEEIDYCRVTRLHNGKYKFERKFISPEKLKQHFFHVQVIGNVVDQKTVFTIYCEDKEYSSFDYGKSLFREVAQYVLSRRSSGNKYPVYITDLDLAPNLLGERAATNVQIVEYLTYKKRIEEKLNRELANL
jgi:adenylate cyclase class 1